MEINIQHMDLLDFEQNRNHLWEIIHSPWKRFWRY